MTTNHLKMTEEPTPKTENGLNPT